MYLKYAGNIAVYHYSVFCFHRLLKTGKSIQGGNTTCICNMLEILQFTITVFSVFIGCLKLVKVPIQGGNTACICNMLEILQFTITVFSFFLGH